MADVKLGLFARLYKKLFKRNFLREGQIYTLNDGQTYDVINRHFEDGSGSWCYDIVVMKDIIDKETGKVIMSGGGYICDQENCSLDKIKKEGILVGQLGKTHYYSKLNNYRLQEIKSIDNFVEYYMTEYTVRTEQIGKKCCKNCRYYRAKLSAQEAEAVKDAVDYLTINNGVFAVCEKGNKIFKEICENNKIEHSNIPLLVGCDVHCSLFRPSVLRIIKSYFITGDSNAGK